LSLFAAFGYFCVTASAAPTPATQRERLPSLAIEATAQFELAFRANPSQGEVRKQQLEAVVAAWRAAPRNDANNERLSNWLRAAIRTSMPGAHDELPASPTFVDATGREMQRPAKPATIARTPEPTLAARSSASSKSSGQTDPFRDDPADVQVSK
jgi:hypothetical protein